MEAVLKREFVLDNLCCPRCAAKIEKHVGALDGVSRALVDFSVQKLVIEVDDAQNAEQWGDIVTRAGAVIKGLEPTVELRDIVLFPHRNAAGAANGREALPVKKLLRRGSLILGAVLFVAGMVIDYVPAVNTLFGMSPLARLALFLASYLLVGGEVLASAARNIRRGEIFDENFLMGIATIGAFAIGEYPEGAAVMFFYRIGEAFQDYAVGRSRKSISALMDIRPDYANLKTAAGLERVSPETVRVGDSIVVKPGEKIPLDGVVTDGFSALDTSALSGESLPRDVERGSDVLSGSINKSGLLTIEVTKVFGESTVSKILNLVQNAGSKKSVTENFITKFARYYTPAVVFSAAALAFLPPLFVPGATLAEWGSRALVFLVVSCPCALVISIPLSFFGGIGGASRNGILIKGSNYLEALTKVDTVIFDKTGTLTRGVFGVTKILPAQNVTEEALLRCAAHAESNSNHPIALSIVKAYGKEIDSGLIGGYEEIAGKGVSVHVGGDTVLAGNARLLESARIAFPAAAEWGTIVYLAVNGTYAGCVVIADELKPDSKRAIEDLRAIGVRQVAMFTGDSKAVGESIAREIGLDTVYAELLPHQKVEHLESLEQTRTGNGKLVFVGDGINDAPVLARSDVGIAMGGVGSDAAIEAADIVLMTDEPSKIAAAIRIARRTRTIVTQNIVFALSVKGVILVMGALGVATMWEAVFGDVGVALIAVLNAMRVMKPSHLPWRRNGRGIA
ncbi:MAG: cadmium-translocating P-type ATPase [Spirochaetaceae bacterium]|jgi:Cd2+/Zn2+-exporting ATPase|nr:cadmium-translocating P-type ATPase [Spirochaetaceae bacterium]